MPDRSSSLCSRRCRRSSDNCAERTRARTLGIKGGSAMAVPTEATTVKTCTPVESQKAGVQNLTTCMMWVPPQATMNNPNSKNIQWKGIILRVP